MGTTNGVSRGQLRPYLTGRTPPFLLVGLLVVLGIFGFSYWSLNTQFNDLQAELQKLQDRLRNYAENREAAEKQNSALQAQLQTSQDSDGKCKIVLDKKQQELNQLTEQLKFYENEVKKATASIEARKADLEKCETINSQKDSNMDSLSGKIKELEMEKNQMKEKIDQLLIDSKSTKPLQEVDLSGIPKSIVQPIVPDKKTDDASVPKSKDKNTIEILDPDVGLPPVNTDSSRDAREIKTTEKLQSLDNVPLLLTDEPQSISNQPNIIKEQENSKTDAVNTKVESVTLPTLQN